MGFLRRLFGPKRTTTSPPAKDKKKWGFSSKDKAPNNNPDTSLSDIPYPGAALDANKHAIAVAAATAAVAEAALAAAHAAAEVVRLTNSGGSGSSQGIRNRHVAAVKIQSAFRGYLARRALRALKALVKLQALVRGHIVRKQTADMLRRMQTLVRVQARVRAGRTHPLESLHTFNKSSLPKQPFPENPDKNGHQQRAYNSKYDGPSILKRCGSNSNFRDVVNLDKARMGSNWLDRWMEESVWNNCQGTSMRFGPGHADDEKNDKILEVDTWKPHLDSQRSTRTFQMPRHVLASDYQKKNFSALDSPSKRSAKAPNPVPNLSSIDALSFSHLKYPIERDEAAVRTAGNSPQPLSASSRPGSSSARRGPFTPAKSERSWGYFSGYSGYPNYMSNTESSRAKARSQSAPRQRLEFERYGSTKRSAHGYWDGWTHSDMNVIHDDNLQSGAYPSFKHMDKFGSSSLR